MSNHNNSSNRSKIQQMEEVGNALVQRCLPKVVRSKTQPQQKGQKIQKQKQKGKTLYQDWYTSLRKEFKVTQVSIRNSSSEEKTISLWGAHQGGLLSTPSPSDVEDHVLTSSISTGVGIHPQGVAVNPANGFTYIANQLSNTVSIINADGQLISSVQLEPANFPGYNSPVALAVNTNSSSSNFGKVYVVGSVANTVSVIDLNHQLTATIAVGSRPLAIAFNPINHNLYVANFAANKISVIDTVSQSLSTTLSVGQAPLAIGINSDNGDLYVANSSDNSVSVFNQDHTPITIITGIGTMPVSMAYHPLNKEVYVVATGSDEVFPIDTLSYTASAPIAVGASPYSIAYNTNNQFLYIGNRADNTYTIIAPDKSIRATLSLGVVNNGFAINQTSNTLFSSNTAASTIDIIGYAIQSTSIHIDEDYLQTNRDFQHNPALVKHAKFVLSSPQRFKVLKIREKGIRGSIKEHPISFSNHQSPQNYLNTTEVFEMEGKIIDGSTSWIFDIAPLQTITILIYYKQFKMYQLI